MNKKDRFHNVKGKIEAALDAFEQTTFTYAEVAGILSKNRNSWDIPAALGAQHFLDFLEQGSLLTKVELESEHYSKLVRYVRKGASPFSIASSIRRNSFFSHGSAVYLHGVSNGSRNEIYVNSEQSPKPATTRKLVQENVDRAFASAQRQSRLIYEYEGRKIIVVNGKFTNRLGVEVTKDKDGNKHWVTSPERTLIDIVVRPAYAGGIRDVIKVYKKFKGRMAIDELLRILDKIDYVYPYHQAIGFYMKQAGYEKDGLAKLKNLGSEIDFYLDYQIGDARSYDEEWRIFYPALN